MSNTTTDDAAERVVDHKTRHNVARAHEAQAELYRVQLRAALSLAKIPDSEERRAVQRALEVQSKAIAGMVPALKRARGALRAAIEQVDAAIELFGGRS